MTRIKSTLSTAIQLTFLLLLAATILNAPGKACAYAALALQLWFEKMIPSLFPFMLLSGLIVRLNFGKYISAPIYPLLGRLYKISRTMCTTLLCGFLFGFPLGAKTVAEQYSLGQLSKPQAQYLLSFCNNIGPVYLLSFALPLLGLSDSPSRQALKTAVTITFFGIPLCYGLALRYIVYRKINLSGNNQPACCQAVSPLGQTVSANAQKPSIINRFFTQKNTPSHPQKTNRKSHLHAASVDTPNAAKTPSFISTLNDAETPSFISTLNDAETLSFISALDASVTSACTAIARLGGYMIFFIVCNLLFEQASALMKTPAAKIFAVKSAAFLSPILEITSGLALSKDILSPALSMTMLTFGGLSCFAQTYTCIRETDLSFGNYCFHKILQSLIALFLYALLFSVCSGKPFS